MRKQYICLDCGMRQGKPDNPLGWCAVCGCIDIIKFTGIIDPKKLITVSYGNDDGYVSLILIEDMIKYRFGQDPDLCEVVIHKIKSDSTGLLKFRLTKALHHLGSISARNGQATLLFDLNDEHINYIKSIKYYYGGFLSIDEKQPEYIEPSNRVSMMPLG